MMFKPETDTPATVEEAVSFWRYWGQKSWFHPDDSDYPLLELNRRVKKAWELKNPWADDMAGAF